jgi:RND family efflux transporter MFP subunit
MERAVTDLSKNVPEEGPGDLGTKDGLSTGSGSSRSLSRDKPQKAESKKRLFITLAVILTPVIGLLLFGSLPRFLQSKVLLDHTQSELKEAPFVAAIVAQPGPEIEEFTLPGNTQAIQDAPIYARVDGYLRDRYVNIGDLVHKGQVMAYIDTPELDQQVQAAASAVEQAKANLDNAQQALDKAMADANTAAANVRKAKTDLQYFTDELGRYEQLAKQGAVSYEDRDTRLQAYNAGAANLDAVVAAERSAQATVSSARAAVHVAEAAMHAAKAQHDQIEATRSFKKVLAPFDGIVTKRNVDAGALITSGSNSNNTLLFEVDKTDILRVFVYVPEQYVSYMHAGEQAILNFQEYLSKDFIGTVTNVSGGIDADSKTLQVEIHVDNANHKLFPGMYASVKFRFPALVRLPIVPATAMQTRADGSFIYTIDNEHRTHMHKVDIGRDLGGQLEITKGISLGDMVIINPPDQLREGEVVSPVVQKMEVNRKKKA